MQEGFDSVHNDFCNQLIVGIAQADGSKVPKVGRVRALWNEANEGMVCLLGHKFLKSQLQV